MSEAATPHRVRLAAAAVLPLVVASLTISASSASASSDEAEDVITRYDLAITLDDDGVAQVVLDLAVDLGSSPNHGPYLTYLVKQRFDETQDRVYRITDVRAASSTAASDVQVEEEGALLVVRVGEEGREYTGEHEYRITYQVEGWVNSAGLTGADDELYLNVLDGWQVPLRAARVSVTGPAQVTEVACWTGGSGADDPCEAASADGTTAVFTQSAVPPGGNLTVLAAYPPRTFGGVGPILQDRWAASRAFALTPWTGAATLVLLLGGAALIARTARLRGRDQQFLGLTPGLLPSPGHDAAVGPRRRGPVTVRFTPPEGFRPGQLGTLVDEHADPRDVTATLVDLAVRGHLQIEEVAGSRKPDWQLRFTGSDLDDPLLPFEQMLLDRVFEGRGVVELSALRTTFSASMTEVQTALYADVTERGWFRGNPRSVRLRWALGGTVLVLTGVAATALLAIWTSWALLGVAVVVLGVLALSLTRAAPARTAAGTAVLVQAEGFRRYLETAEAAQLRWEEGEDLFSRYLPHAIAFGLTERWARVFADAAAAGRTVPDPAWYVGSYAHASLWSSGSFTDSVTSFADVTQSALVAPTPGSSGSSGSSGGFSGGGVGGGGGGTW